MVMKSPQLTIAIILITKMFECVLKCAVPMKTTAVFHINRNRPTYTFCDQFPRGLIWSTSRDTRQVENKLEQDFQISKHHLIYLPTQVRINFPCKLIDRGVAERKLDKGLEDRFW